MSGDYSAAILAWLSGREDRLSRVRLQSPQLHRRRDLVTWSCRTASDLGLRTVSLHLAVRILDRFMDGHDIEEPQLYLVCLCCLLLASKLQEKDSNIPRLSRLRALLPEDLPEPDSDMISSVEVMMLHYFRWDVSLPTACDVAELLLPLALHPADYLLGRPLLHWPQAQDDFLQAVRWWLDVSLQEESLLQTPAHLLGPACLLAARQTCGLDPSWPQDLARLTGLDRRQVEPVVELLTCRALHEDEGYMSICPSPEPTVASSPGS